MKISAFSCHMCQCLYKKDRGTRTLPVKEGLSFVDLQFYAFTFPGIKGGNNTNFTLRIILIIILVCEVF